MNSTGITEYAKLGDLVFTKTWLCENEELDYKTMKCFSLRNGETFDSHYVDYQPYTENENLLNIVNPIFLLGEGYVFFYSRKAFFLDFNESFMVQIQSTGSFRSKFDLDFKLKSAWQAVEYGFNIGTKFGCDYAKTNS